jgi:hypothetical protein
MLGKGEKDAKGEHLDLIYAWRLASRLVFKEIMDY